MAYSLPRIGLVQLNSGARPYLPYVAGLLQVWVEYRTPGQYQFLTPLAEFESVEAAVQHLQAAQVVGFSAYVWNFRRSLAIARALKQQCPTILTVFGGPHIPAHSEDFLRQHPYVDLCVHGEGEEAFYQILTRLPRGPFSGLPGVSGLDQSGNYFYTPPAPRRQDLSALPSPYLSGAFDALMAAAPGTPWAILWETNRGCPFSCTFCDWGSATRSKVFTFDLPRLQAELDWFAAHRIEYIFCCDANFGLLPRDVELAEYAAQVRAKTGYPRALVVQNSKNVTDRAFAVHRILARAGLDMDVTLSMQSLSPAVLKAVQRENISLDYYAELRRRLMKEGIKAYTDMILGLPGETLDSFITGLCTLISHGQFHEIKIFSAHILPNAPMAEPSYRRTHGLETVETYTVYLHTPVKQVPVDCQEKVETIIATATMPREDWVQAKAFSYLLNFLFFTPGLLKMALVILHFCFKQPLRPMLELFTQAPTPLLSQIWQNFLAQARAVQAGGYEYVHRPEPWALGIWWQPHELALRTLVFQGKLVPCLAEARYLLQQWLQAQGQILPEGLLEDCIQYSLTFILLLHQQEVSELRLRWNLWEVWQALLVGEDIPLRPQLGIWRKTWRGQPFTLQRIR